MLRVTQIEMSKNSSSLIVCYSPHERLEINFKHVTVNMCYNVYKWERTLLFKNYKEIIGSNVNVIEPENIMVILEPDILSTIVRTIQLVSPLVFSSFCDVVRMGGAGNHKGSDALGIG